MIRGCHDGRTPARCQSTCLQRWSQALKAARSQATRCSRHGYASRPSTPSPAFLTPTHGSSAYEDNEHATKCSGLLGMQGSLPVNRDSNTIKPPPIRPTTQHALDNEELRNPLQRPMADPAPQKAIGPSAIVLDPLLQFPAQQSAEKTIDALSRPHHPILQHTAEHIAIDTLSNSAVSTAPHLAAAQLDQGSQISRRILYVMQQIQRAAAAGKVPEVVLTQLMHDKHQVDMVKLKAALQSLPFSGHAIVLSYCVHQKPYLPDEVMQLIGNSITPLLLQAISAERCTDSNRHRTALSQSEVPQSQIQANQQQQQPQQQFSNIAKMPGANTPQTMQNPAAVTPDVRTLGSAVSILHSLGSLKKHCGLYPMALLLKYIQPHMKHFPPSLLVGVAQALSYMEYYPYMAPGDELLAHQTLGNSNHDSAVAGEVGRAHQSSAQHQQQLDLQQGAAMFGLAANETEQPDTATNAFKKDSRTDTCLHHENEDTTWMQVFLRCVLDRITSFTGPQVCSLLRALALLETHPWASSRTHRPLKQKLIAAVNSNDAWTADVFELLPRPSIGSDGTDTRKSPQKAGNSSIGKPSGQPSVVEAQPAYHEPLNPRSVRIALWALIHFSVPVQPDWLMWILHSAGRCAHKLTPASLVAAVQIMAEYRLTPRQEVRKQVYTAVRILWDYFSPNRLTALLWYSHLTVTPMPTTMIVAILRRIAALAQHQMKTQLKNASGSSGTSTTGLVKDSRVTIGTERVAAQHILRCLCVAAHNRISLPHSQAVAMTYVLAKGMHILPLGLAVRSIEVLSACSSGLFICTAQPQTSNDWTQSLEQGVAPCLQQDGHTTDVTTADHSVAYAMTMRLAYRAVSHLASILVQVGSPAQCARAAWSAVQLGLLLKPTDIAVLLYRAAFGSSIEQYHNQARGVIHMQRNNTLDAAEQLSPKLRPTEAAMLVCVLHGADASGIPLPRPVFHVVPQLIQLVESQHPDLLDKPIHKNLLPSYIYAASKLQAHRFVRSNPLDGLWCQQAYCVIEEELASYSLPVLAMLLELMADWQGKESSQRVTDHRMESVSHCYRNQGQAIQQQDVHSVREDAAIAHKGEMPGGLQTSSMMLSLTAVSDAVLSKLLQCQADALQLPAGLLADILWNCARLSIRLPAGMLAGLMQAIGNSMSDLSSSQIPKVLLAAACLTQQELEGHRHARQATNNGLPNLATWPPDNILVSQLPCFPAALLDAIDRLEVDALKRNSPKHSTLPSSLKLQRYVSKSRRQALGQTDREAAQELLLSSTIASASSDQLCSMLLGLACWQTEANKPVIDVLLHLIQNRNAGNISWLGIVKCVQGLVLMKKWPSLQFYNFLEQQVQRVRSIGRVSIQDDLHMRQLMHQLAALQQPLHTIPAARVTHLAQQQQVPEVALEPHASYLHDNSSSASGSKAIVVDTTHKSSTLLEVAGQRLLRRLFLYQLQAALRLMSHMLSPGLAHPGTTLTGNWVLKDSGAISGNLAMADAVLRLLNTQHKPTNTLLPPALEYGSTMLVGDHMSSNDADQDDESSDASNVWQDMHTQLASTLQAQLNQALLSIAVSKGVSVPATSQGL